MELKDREKSFFLDRKNDLDDMAQMRHMLYDYILPTPLPLIFTVILDYKNKVDEFKYAKKNATNNAEKEKYSKYISSVYSEWAKDMSKGLVNFYCARYLGSSSHEKDFTQRLHYVTTLFREIFAYNTTPFNNLRELLGRFFSMLKDYLIRNVPDLENVNEDSNIKEVMTAVRNLYRNCSKDEVAKVVYVNFNSKRLTYANGLIELMDNISVEYETSDYCKYFHILMECLYTLFIYVYMCEFIIYNNDKSSQNLFTYLKNLKFNLNI